MRVDGSHCEPPRDTLMYDEDAVLAAEAFAFGLGEEFLLARKAEITRRISERYGTADPGSNGGDRGAIR